MYLREGEQVMKVFHHHPAPFAKNVFKIILGTLPFFMILYLFSSTMSRSAIAWSNIVVVLIFILILIYHALVYWLDRLVVTNQRVIHIDWKYLTIRNEYETELNDIQDIHTKEKGVLAAFWIFDYGTFRLQTSSHEVTINFTEAPDPEGIRQFIYNIKPN